MSQDVKDLAKRLERIVRDAIIFYQEVFSEAPNDDVREELQKRAIAANEWLTSHGFQPESLMWRETALC